MRVFPPFLIAATLAAPFGNAFVVPLPAFADEPPSITDLPTTPPSAAPADSGPRQYTADELAAGIPCTVTAYYSPLADQERYARGNFEDEKTLQGNGTNGASGKEVFVGMVAAPKGYPFGTKVYIPGFGLGDIQDRGGAIKNNRFDIWLGKGDLGLSRALAWGKRSLTCRLYLPGSEVPESAKKEADLLQMPAASREVSGKPADRGFYTRDFTIGDQDAGVKSLEADLAKLKYFAGKPDQNYDLATAQAVFAFQKAEGIVTDQDSFGAGYFGYQTRRALNRVRAGSAPAPAAPKTIEKPSLRNLKHVIAKGESGPEVLEAQRLLSLAGFYPADKQTGVFGDLTRDAIYRFQVAQGIIAAATDAGAGQLGPVTAAKMMEVAARQAARSTVYALGAKNDTVKSAQSQLAALGRLPADSITGNFGPQTKAALMSFQIERRLVAGRSDPNAGKLGPRTFAALEEALASRRVQDGALKHGDRGAPVKELQQALIALGVFKGPVSGYFGDATETAVRAAQKRLGLIARDDDPVAGIVPDAMRRVIAAGTRERLAIVGAEVKPGAPAEASGEGAVIAPSPVRP